MAIFLVCCLLLWGSAAQGLDQYAVETLRYDVLAPEGAKRARLFWEGEIKNNTAQDATLSPVVLLLDEKEKVLCELKLPDVTVGRLGKERRKELLLVDPELWKKTRSIGGKATSGEKDAAKKGEPDVELYCVSDFIGCRYARDFLRKYRIAFAEYDVKTDAEAARRLKKDLKLAVQWPTLIINGKPIVGYSQDRYLEAFGIEE